MCQPLGLEGFEGGCGHGTGEDSWSGGEAVSIQDRLAIGPNGDRILVPTNPTPHYNTKGHYEDSRYLARMTKALPPGLVPLVEELGADLEVGLTTDEASQRREQEGSFNVVSPPINCPGWVCCLLPCIKSIPSMKAFASLKPEDAEVLRNAKWIRYDAASLVKGDVIRMEEGDVVPADCVVLKLSEEEEEDEEEAMHLEEEELLVDLRPITGEDRLTSITAASIFNGGIRHKLYMGGKVVQGGGIAVITEVGPETLLAKLIRENRFPPKEPILEASASETTGIAMGSLS